MYETIPTKQPVVPNANESILFQIMKRVKNVLGNCAEQSLRLKFFFKSMVETLNVLL